MTYSWRLYLNTVDSITRNLTAAARQDRVAHFKRHHFIVNAIEQRYFWQQKTGKTGSRLQKQESAD